MHLYAFLCFYFYLFIFSNVERGQYYLHPHTVTLFYILRLAGLVTFRVNTKFNSRVNTEVDSRVNLSAGIRFISTSTISYVG